MLEWRSLVPFGIAFVLGLAVGAGVESRKVSARDAEIAELKEEHHHLIDQINRETNEAYAALADKLADREKRLAAALSARDDALALAANARADASRLRILADNRSKALRALPSGGGASCAGEREQLARCTQLLGEGAELVGEGAGLSLGIAGDKGVAGVR